MTALMVGARVRVQDNDAYVAPGRRGIVLGFHAETGNPLVRMDGRLVAFQAEQVIVLGADGDEQMVDKVGVARLPSPQRAPRRRAPMTAGYDRTLGEMLGDFCVARGLSQCRLAAACDVEPSAISRIMRNKRRPGVALLAKMADVLQCDELDRVRLIEALGFPIRAQVHPEARPSKPTRKGETP